MYWPFNTSTPSQSEIFFQIFFVTVVIGFPIFSEIFFKICYSNLTRVPTLDRGCMSLNEGTTAIYEIDTNYNNREYFTLGGCAIQSTRPSQSEIFYFKAVDFISKFVQYFILGGCAIQSTITENISLLVMEGQYIHMNRGSNLQ